MSPMFKRIAGPALALLLMICATVVMAHDDVAINYDLKADAPAPVHDRTDVLVEGFEGAFPPAGWTTFSAAPEYPWVQRDNNVHTGEHSAAVMYGPQGVQQDEWLVTPAIDLTGFTMPLLEWFEAEDYWADYGDHHRVLVSTTDASSMANFSVVLDMVPSNHEVNGMEGEPVTVDLSDFIGETIYIALQYTGNWADNWYVDDFRVYEPFAHDIAAVTVVPEDEQFAAGDILTPQAHIRNVGLNAEALDVEMVIAENGVVVYTETYYVDEIVPGEYGIINFPTLALNGGSYYNLTITTLLDGDMATGNDCATGACNTWTQTHVPLAFLFTNSGCDPCVASNQALDAYMPTVGNDFALMRIHAWWPNGNDMLFLAAEAQCRALIAEYGTSGVPDFWLDGTINDSALNTGLLNTSQTWKSPLNMALVYSVPDQRLTVNYDVIDGLDPLGDYQLFVGLTEDGVEHNGGNGEPIHNQAFRALFPGTDAGLAVDTSAGSHSVTVDLTVDAAWVYENLRATAYVQNRNTRKMTQACTNLLTEIDDSTPVALSFFDARQVGAAVELRWEAVDAGVEDFGLVRVHEGVETELSFTRDGAASFRAVDTGDALAAGGRFEYRLFGEGMLLQSRGLDVAAAPAATAIRGAFPNPFNPVTKIACAVGEAGPVSLNVYDINGRLVRNLVDARMPAGDFEVSWNGTDDGGAELASGVYFVRLATSTDVKTSRVVLAK